MTDGNLIKFVRLTRVKELTGLGRSQIYALEKQGRFPRKTKILPNTTVWIESEVYKWMMNRIAQCRNEVMEGEA